LTGYGSLKICVWHEATDGAVAREVNINVAGLVGALLPVFFVLALGFWAGKVHTFDIVQAAGFSQLALGFALPSALFVSMTDIRRDLLLAQGGCAGLAALTR
jgi:predicted permease